MTVPDPVPETPASAEVERPVRTEPVGILDHCTGTRDRARRMSPRGPCSRRPPWAGPDRSEPASRRNWPEPWSSAFRSTAEYRRATGIVATTSTSLHAIVPRHAAQVSPDKGHGKRQRVCSGSVARWAASAPPLQGDRFSNRNNRVPVSTNQVRDRGRAVAGDLTVDWGHSAPSLCIIPS